MKNFIKYSVIVVFTGLLIFTSCENEIDSNFPLLTDEVVSIDQSLDQAKLHEINQLLLENGYAPYTEERLKQIQQKASMNEVEFRSCIAEYYGDISTNSCIYYDPNVSGVDLVIMLNIIEEFDTDPVDDKVETSTEYNGTTYNSCVVQNAGTISYYVYDTYLYHLEQDDVDITAWYILYSECPEPE